MNIFSVLSTATWALHTSQTEIGVTGQNVANINNPNYTKETANIIAGPTQDYGRYSIGSGISVANVTSSFSSYLFNQSLDNNTSVASWTATSGELNQMNQIMNDTNGTGISNAISKFFSAFQTLSNNPADATARQSTVAAGQTLSAQISGAATSLGQMQINENSNIKALVPKINDISNQITALNKEIHQTENSGNVNNNARDQRNGLIKQLSGLTGISYFEQSNGEDVVMLKNGTPLVAGEAAYNLSTGISKFNPQLTNIYWNSPNGNQTDITSTISGGQLGALVASRDGAVATALSNLNTLAGAITTGVNNLNASGYGLDGSTGVNFFNPLTPGGAGASTNTGTGVITGTLINQGNVDTSQFNLAFDGTNYTVTNKDQGNATALSGASFASVQSFFQQRGYSISMTGTPKAGDSFSVSAVNNAAVLMSVNSTVVNDVNKIAAGSTTQVGDGTNARLVGNLGTQKIVGGAWSATGTTGSTGVYSLNDYYASAVGSVGTQTKTATDNVTLYQGSAAQTSNLIEQSSGVNMDEEMVNLVKFQNAYQASAKTITIVDQMLKTLMNVT